MAQWVESLPGTSEDLVRSPAFTYKQGLVVVQTVTPAMGPQTKGFSELAGHLVLLKLLASNSTRDLVS